MKAFEKWYNELPIREDFTLGTQAKYKKGWRAALKEVLEQLNVIYDGDFENSDIVEWIKKELGDKDDQS